MKTTIPKRRWTQKQRSALILFSLLLTGFSTGSMADHERVLDSDDVEASVFYSYEANGEDYITGIGAGILFKDEHSNLGFGFNTSLKNAEVLATDGYLEDYVAWEGAIRVGYFSKVYAYAEAGIDLTELFFHDIRHDSHGDGYYEDDDDLDAYVGFGLGVNLGRLQVEGFSRLREIDSYNWEAESEWFSGIQLSIRF